MPASQHPYGDLLSKPPALFELIRQRGAKLRESRPVIPLVLAQEAAPMVAHGWLPPGGATDEVVRRVLEDTWVQVRRDGESAISWESQGED